MAKSEVVFYLVSACVFGIFVGSLTLPIFTIIVSGVLIIFFAPQFRLTRNIAVLMCISMFFGYCYVFLFQNIQTIQLRLPEPREVKVLEALIISEPQAAKNSVRMTAELQEPYHGVVTILTNDALDIHYGDMVSVHGRIERDDNRPPMIPFPGIEITERNHGSLFMRTLLQLKRSAIGQFKKFLPTESAAFLAGLTLGSREEFSESFKQRMSDAGTSHLTALSGYNIAILIAAITVLLRNLVGRRMRFILTVTIIIAFVIMVGGESSVIRAAIMGFLVILAQETGRIYAARNAIAVTAFLMLIFDPMLLNSNIGFQLSFLSLVGIIYLAPIFLTFLKAKNNPGLFGLREHLATTLAAQLMVIPVIVLAFGEFSLTAIIANILVLEVVPITMFLGFLLILIGSLLPFMGFVIAQFVLVPLTYMQVVIDIFAQLRLPFGPTLFTGASIAVYYFILMVFIIRNSQKTKSYEIA